MKIFRVNILVFSFLLSACSGKFSELEDYLECLIVADQLRITKSFHNIDKKMRKFMQENQLAETEIEQMKILILAQNIKNNVLSQNDLGNLIEIYNSKFCKSLHQDPENLNIYKYLSN